ncbi:MAG: PAS domain-containing protein, partial [Anaerovorax sp.]
MGNNNYLNDTSRLTVEQMMNTNFKCLHLEDSLETVVKYYQKYKMNTLPIVDENKHLLGVFPKKRLFKALLEGASLSTPCRDYMIEKPVFVMIDRTYDEYSMTVRVTKSPVDNVVVLDLSNKVVGMIGTMEYFRESLNVITASSAMLESLFRVNYEGIMITDRNGIVIRINPAAEKMFRLNFARVKGKHLGEIFPDLVIPEGLQLGVKRIIQTLHVVINQVPIIENGEEIGSSLAFLDVSHVEKIAEELEIVKELQTTIDGVLGSSSDGVFVSDISGRIKYANERACQLVSQAGTQIIGMQVQELLQTNSPKKVAHSGSPEVDCCEVHGKMCIVSHIPIKKNDIQDKIITGIVSTAYLNDNVVTEEIARKWFF